MSKKQKLNGSMKTSKTLRNSTKKRCSFHHRGLKSKSTKSEKLGVMGKFDLGLKNEAGQRLIEFRQENALVIASIFVQQNTRDDYTHGHYQMVNTEIRLIMFLAAKMGKLYTVSKTRPGADCGSDHELFIAKFRLKLKKADH